MKPFEVLNRNIDVHRHYLLEASAGTGKTYAIENIVARLLIEPPQLTLDKILVVTFTRAATRDLKERVRSNIQKALLILDHYCETGPFDLETPDYLLSMIQNNAKETVNARRALEQALFSFGQAQIYTIHSFCSRMLRNYVFDGGVSLDAINGDSQPSRSKLLKIVRDFLRTEMNRLLTEPQIAILMGKHRNDLNVLQNKLLDSARKACEIDTIVALTAETTEFEIIFASVAKSCQQHMRRYFCEEEILHFDDIITAMLDAVKQPSFAGLVRNQFKAVIIDEFQDTDPIQWEIFRILFLGENREWGHLYLVGDPKQSIYAFRHADVYTYMAAAQAIGDENKGTLNTNYRSSKSLVEVLNAIFSLETTPGLLQLPRSGMDLTYQPVGAGSKSNPPALTDDLGAVHFFIRTEPRKPRDRDRTAIERCMRNSFYPYISQEIQRLHGKDGIKYSSFAILVATHLQGKEISDYLKAQGIPCSKQKCDKLSESDAMKSMRELLEAVITPRSEDALKIALGGQIIGWTLDRIRELEDPVLKEKILFQFYQLRRNLFYDGFAVFFQHFMQTSFHPDSKSIAEAILSRQNGLDLYNVLTQIAEVLAEEQSRNRLSADRLFTFLESKIFEDEENEDTLTIRPNPDMDAVVILTNHVSKGLEYDIVFALGLATRGREPDILMPHPEVPRTYVPARQNPELYEKHCAESDAEKIRQLYVVMTRAKYRLYVPVVFTENPPEQGTASPMELFLARFGKPLTDYAGVYERIKNNNQAALQEILEKMQPEFSLTFSFCTEKALEAIFPLPSTVPQWAPEPGISFFWKPCFISSFTSLTKKKHSDKNSPVPAPSDFDVEDKSPLNLPAGNHLGTLLHSIFETISFTEIARCAHFREIIPLITPYIEGSEFAAWKDAFAMVIYNAFNILLPLKDPAALKEINPNKIYRETEFLFPWDSQVSFEDIERIPGYLKGVIDLVFEHKGKYYILDWKSNWLGNLKEDYSRESMSRAMEDHGYFLQAQVYKEAMRRYIELLDDRSFDENFGGVIYVFVRGVSPDWGYDYGVYLI